MPIKISIVFKSGREFVCEITGYKTFREAANCMLKANWNVFDDTAFQTTEIESISNIELN